MATQDHINKDIAEKWFNKGIQIGSGREPNKEDAPYRDAPKPGDPDYTPPPSFPGQDVPKLQLAHNFWDGESLSDKWGAVWNEADEQWMLPPDSPNGNYRFATDEESQMLEDDRLHRDQYDQNTPHPHQEGWNQAMYNPNDKPQRMFKVTDKDKQLNNPAWQRFMEGNPNYMYTPLQKADAQGLTDTLSPFQNQRSGSLRDSGLSDDEKKKLLIRGVEAYKAQ